MTFNFSMQAIDQVVNSAAKTSYMSAGEVSWVQLVGVDFLLMKNLSVFMCVYRCTCKCD